jgi:hypothetical protein
MNDRPVEKRASRGDAGRPPRLLRVSVKAGKTTKGAPRGRPLVVSSSWTRAARIALRSFDRLTRSIVFASSESGGGGSELRADERLSPEGYFGGAPGLGIVAEPM